MPVVFAEMFARYWTPSGLVKVKFPDEPMLMLLPEALQPPALETLMLLLLIKKAIPALGWLGCRVRTPLVVTVNHTSSLMKS